MAMSTSPTLFELPFLALYIGLLLRLAWIDYRCMLLPDNLTYSLLWSGLLYQLFFIPENLATSVLGAICGYLSLWGLYWIYFYWRKCEGIGYGDMKLLAALGAWHGWQSLGWILFTASSMGLFAVLISKLLRKKTISLTTTPLPFGPYLAIAGGLAGWIYSSYPLFNELNFLL